MENRDCDNPEADEFTIFISLRNCFTKILHYQLFQLRKFNKNYFWTSQDSTETFFRFLYKRTLINMYPLVLSVF